MAHFAQLDENNIVINVICVDDKDVTTPQAWWDPFKIFTAKESEEVGISFCRYLCKDPDSKWVQTCPHNTFRGVHAGIGMTYMTGVKTLGVASTDIFIEQQPYPSSIISPVIPKWTTPIKRPLLDKEQWEDNKIYTWDEDVYNEDTNNPKVLGWVLTQRNPPEMDRSEWNEYIDEFDDQCQECNKIDPEMI